MRIQIFLIFIFLMFWPYSLYAQTEDTDNSQNRLTIEAKENVAIRHFETENYNFAHDIYLSLEKTLIEYNYTVLNESYLLDKAITAYKCNKPAWAAAHLQQLYILNHSEDVRQMLFEVQSLIEHKIYQNAPNTEFIRGQSKEYSAWEVSHHYSRNVLIMHFVVSWYVLFIVVSCLIIFRRKKYIFKACLYIGGIFLFLTAIFGQFVRLREQTDDMQFGILTDSVTVFSEPALNADNLMDDGFRPGLLVKLVNRSPGWVKVERSDGRQGWCRTGYFYRLRGRGSQIPNRIED